ncbi:MAG: acetylxylan esterase [Bryobacterales bacterium]|nr:acetylxylan esterase [Bryobacterales bacterium]MDE0622257.1 acetylxylan esterase [Bryobacterales bacterium]
MSAMRAALVAVICLSQSGVGAFAQQEWRAPVGVNWRTDTILSEGTRLAAEIFSPSDRDGEMLPCILMAHGWGGTARGLRRDAVVFARAGYLAVAFDYRGWGNSDPRVILANPAPDGKPGTFRAEVIAIREVVDPVEQGRDWLNALHWLQAEPMCDTQRIGVWGSSYSGGHVLYAAAHDRRVKAVFSQVGGMDSRFVAASDDARARTLKEATLRARGQLPYPAPGAVEVGALRGAPIRDKLMHYAPVELARQASHAALMFVIAEHEELFDNRDHAIKAHAAATGVKKLVTLPGIKHYGIYREARERAQQLAVEWFDAHL